MTTTAAPQGDAPAGLSNLDRFLPLWIGVAMVVGLGLGRALPGLDDLLDTVRIDTVSLLIALGLLLMMYPVLAKVRYANLPMQPLPRLGAARPRRPAGLPVEQVRPIVEQIERRSLALLDELLGGAPG